MDSEMTEDNRINYLFLIIRTSFKVCERMRVVFIEEFVILSHLFLKGCVEALMMMHRDIESILKLLSIRTTQ